MGTTVKNKDVDNSARNNFIDSMLFYMKLCSLKHLSYLIDVPFVAYTVTISCFGTVSGWVMFYYKYDDLEVNTDHLLYAVIWGHLLYDYTTYFLNRSVMVNINKEMYNRFSQFNEQLDEIQKFQYIWEEADRVSLFVMRFMNVSVILLYISHIYNAGIFSPGRKLILPLWVPYSLEPDFNYYLTITVQFTMLFLNSTVHLSGLAFCIGGSHFIGASFDVLGNVYTEICEKVKETDETGSKLSSAPDHILAEEKLKWCVKTHVALLRFVKAYKSVAETILIEVLLSCEVVICFAGFQAVLAVENKNHAKVVQHCSMIIVITFHVFTYCYPGQHIYNKSEQFRNRLYLSHWEEQSLSFQKSMIIMMTATVRPITISFRGIANASLPSFQHAMRTAFSYVNILMVLREVSH